MKLWKKISLLAVLMILLATGIFGAVVLYQTATYSLNQTIAGYRRQVTSNIYAMSQEMKDNSWQQFGETARRSFFQYMLNKYGNNDYMLLQGDRVLCNTTDFDMVNPDYERWSNQQVNYVVQKDGNQHVLIMGKKFSTDGRNVFLLLLVKDISYIYSNIQQQLGLMAVVYLALAAVAVNIIFWVTRRMLRPLHELQRTATAISDGDLSRRVKVRRMDEVGQVAQVFNQMADRVEAQVEELEDVSERRKQLLGSLTHELKTSMTSIIGYSDTLLHVKISEEQRDRALEHINAECKRLERLSGKMMNLIGLYNNESIHLEEFSVQELLDRVVALERYHVKESNMQIIVTCTMDKLPMDVDLMESLLVNLIDNSIKASGPGDTIDVLAMNNRITVRDWGKGIPPEEIPKITEAFYMVDKSRSKRAGGIGLGLALCKQIAKLHGAHLEIESWLDDGTAISVVFEDYKTFTSQCGFSGQSEV